MTRQDGYRMQANSKYQKHPPVAPAVRQTPDIHAANVAAREEWRRTLTLATMRTEY